MFLFYHNNVCKTIAVIIIIITSSKSAFNLPVFIINGWYATKFDIFSNLYHISFYHNHTFIAHLEHADRISELVYPHRVTFTEWFQQKKRPTTWFWNRITATVCTHTKTCAHKPPTWFNRKSYYSFSRIHYLPKYFEDTPLVILQQL